jgi:ribosome biogenesis GTPase
VSSFPDLEPYGWDDRLEALWAGAPAGTVPGRVVRADRGRLVLQVPEGVAVATSNAARWLDQPDGQADEHVVPTTGDWVAAVPGPPDVGELATVAAVAPRRSRIARIDALGRDEQVLATNVDTVLIVHGLDRELKPGRIERSLVLAWDSGARPALVLTKADLVPGWAAVRDELVALAGATPVHVVSGRTGEGLDEVRAHLAGHRTVAVLGESGAGKSTIVNHLLGSEVQATASVRAGDARGRHTTVTRDLLLVPGGGVLVDTPGLRSLGLPDAYEGLALTYADIEELARGCRFRDCGHTGEPGCAVQAAVEGDSLTAGRLARYVELSQEAASVEARRDVQARQERKRQGKILERAYRASQKQKRGPR